MKERGRERGGRADERSIKEGKNAGYGIYAFTVLTCCRCPKVWMHWCVLVHSQLQSYLSTGQHKPCNSAEVEGKTPSDPFRKLVDRVLTTKTLIRRIYTRGLQRAVLLSLRLVLCSLVCAGMCHWAIRAQSLTLQLQARLSTSSLVLWAVSSPNSSGMWLL